MRFVPVALALLGLVLVPASTALASGEDVVKADDEKTDTETKEQAEIPDEWIEPGVSTIEDLLLASSSAEELLKPQRSELPKVEWVSAPCSSSPKPDPS